MLEENIINFQEAKPNRFVFSQIILLAYTITALIFYSDAENIVYSNLTGVLLAVVFVIEFMRQKDFRMLFSKTLLPFVFFLIVSSVSIISHPDSFARYLTTVQVFILGAIVMNIVARTDKLWPIEIAFYLALTYSAYHFFQEGKFFKPVSDTERESVLNYNTNEFAYALSTGMLFIIHRYISLRKNKFNAIITKSILLFLMFLFSYENIMFTGSRKGMILSILLFVFFFIILLQGKSFFIRIFYIIIGVIASAFIITFLINSPFWFRMQNFFAFVSGNKLVKDENSLGERTEMFHDAIHLWSQKPIFGWGFDQFRHITEYGGYSHNGLGELLCNSGIVGALSYYLIFILAGIMVFKRLKYKAYMTNTLWAGAVIMVSFLSDMTGVLYFNKIQWILLGTVLGIIKAGDIKITHDILALQKSEEENLNEEKNFIARKKVSPLSG